MQHYTSIEINEVETEVIVNYSIVFGEPQIDKITDVHTGDAIAPDLLDETDTDDLLNELFEAYSDEKAEREATRKVNYLATV